MDISILGPLEVRRGDTAVSLGAPKLRALLVALVLELGRAVPSSRLIDQLWDDQPPPQPLVSLRSYISNLRRLLQEPGTSPVITTGGGGYALQVGADCLDATRFERLVRDGRDALAGDEPAKALECLSDALAMWRGEALADVANEPFARPAAAKLEALRLTASEARFDALLTLGRHVEAIPELESFVAEQPLREPPHRQLMLALYRSGRAADALQVATRHRATLIEEVGLDPSPQLGQLSDLILRQDPALEPRLVGTPDVVHGTTRSAPPPAAEGLAAEPPRRRVTSTIIGRDREREVLGSALQGLSLGHGGLLVVAGEPGIGKTALLQELGRLADAATVPVAWGHGLEQEGAPPFWPWIEVVRTLAGNLDDAALKALLAGPAVQLTPLVPDLAARTGLAPEIVAGAPDTARFALFDAVASFLTAVARERGVVVVMDDLHWTDPASLQLMGFLTGRVRAGGILLVGGYRDAPTDRTAELEEVLAGVARQPDAVTLQLRPLTRDDVVAIVTEIVGEPPDDTVVADVYRRADGNPFFVRQLAALVAERDGAAADDTTIPIGVRHVLLQRLQHVAPAVRATLELAATIGQGFDVRTVAVAAESDVLTVLDHVDVAIRHGLVEVGEAHASAYRFVHALVRETLYDELTPGRAARLHAAVASALERLDPPPAEALAEHLWRAADVVAAADTVRWLRAAADEAVGVLGYEQAEQHLRRALHLLSRDDADARSELAVRLQLVQVLTGLYGWTTVAREEVSGPVRQLAGHAGLGAEVVPLWWSLWSTMMTRGDLQASQELAEELLGQAVAAGDPASLVAGHVAVAYTALFAGADLEAVLEPLELAARAEAAADPASLTLTPEHLGVSRRVNVAIAHALLGDPAAVAPACQDLVEYCRRVGGAFQEAYAHLFAGWAMAAIDRPQAALELGTIGLARCDEARLGSVALLITPFHGWAAARCGADQRDQAARVGAAIDAQQAAGQSHAVANWLVFQAEILALDGDLRAAEAALARAEALARGIGEMVYGRQIGRVRATIRR